MKSSPFKHKLNLRGQRKHPDRAGHDCLLAVSYTAKSSNDHASCASSPSRKSLRANARPKSTRQNLNHLTNKITEVEREGRRIEAQFLSRKPCITQMKTAALIRRTTVCHRAVRVEVVKLHRICRQESDWENLQYRFSNVEVVKRSRRETATQVASNVRCWAATHRYPLLDEPACPPSPPHHPPPIPILYLYSTLLWKPTNRKLRKT